MNNTTTQTPAITFQTFIDSREAADDISKVIQCDELEDQKGYVYLRDGKSGYYIQQTDAGMFWTIAIREETLTNTLAEAEVWLWNNFIFDEVCADLNRIPAFDFDNITPDTCDEWIKKLNDAELLYHFDDDPADIITGDIKTFSELECETLEKIVDAMHSLDGYDPFETCVALTK